ncbi:MAG TPA: hypothetical protein VFX51_10850 [Solirubrobacteraceae bacterium]|nr:hypothetical protein [Solirubrobacteraceae bacterium]
MGGLRQRMAGPPAAPLVAATCATALVLLAVTALALPGDPGQPWDGISSAAQDPFVLVPLGVMVAVAALACVRAWSYRRLLYGPGPIEVVSIEEAAGSDGAAPVERLDLKLRQRLSEMRLTAPSTTPGARASTDFVELLETSHLDPKQPFAAIGRILRLVRPTHAYEVRATLLRREHPPRFGVAMEVVVLPKRRTVMRTYWSSSWEVAIDRAASGVTVQVVPRSRHSEAGTWCSWRGLDLDEVLFDHYQYGQRLRGKRRFEEALEHLYAAIRRDPANGYLRYALASLQEELALYVDALVTYEAIPRATGSARGRYGALAADRIALLARYRATVLLGFGDQLAEQWLAAPVEAPVTRRSAELRTLRARLRPALIAAFGDLEPAPGDLQLLDVHGSEDVARLLDDRPHLELHPPSDQRPMTPSEKTASRRLRERRLHLFFQLLANGQVQYMRERYSRDELKRLDAGVTAVALDLLPARGELRAERARRMLDHELRPRVDTESSHDDWPPTPEQIRELWAKVPTVDGRTLSRRLADSADYSDHYNAACTFAVCLLPAHGAAVGADPQRVELLAEAAVDELRRAADAAGSAGLAERWDWILTEDPDLAGLRGERAFQRFETERFPSARPAPVRPSGIVRLQASRYSSRLCCVCARQLEETWHARAAEDGDTDIHRAIAWWHDEEATWELAREIALNHRHWQTRLRIIKEMHRFTERNDRPRFRVTHPRYAERPIEAPRPAVDKAGRKETQFGHMRIAALTHALGPPGGPRLPGFATWEQYLLALDEAGQALPAAERKRLADQRAAAWGAIRHAFSEPPTFDGDPRERFQRRFEEIVHGLGELRPSQPEMAGPTRRFAPRSAAPDQLAR